MMTIWTKSPSAPTRDAPSPLLRHLAGGHAPRVAGLWAAPHAAFINAGADRRHLVCLALSAPDEVLDRPTADALLGLPFRLAVGRAVPSAPAGLARALAHIGEVAWEADDYRRLLAVLGVHRLAAGLRHAKLITPDRLKRLDILPEALREAGVGARDLTAAQTALLAETFLALVARDGPAAAADEARGWVAGSSVKDILQRARRSLDREPAPYPFPGSEHLRPLSTKAALLEAAGRYRNCLGSCISNAADGSSAYYEWTGEPSAAVELYNDPLFGWRLSQARLVDNAAVPEAVRAQITAELREWGVHVGRSIWDLYHGLDRAHADSFELETLEECVDELYGA